MKAWKRDGSKRFTVDDVASCVGSVAVAVSSSFSGRALISSGPEGSEAREASWVEPLSAKKRLFLVGRSSICDMLILHNRNASCRVPEKLITIVSCDNF